MQISPELLSHLIRWQVQKLNNGALMHQWKNIDVPLIGIVYTTPDTQALEHDTHG